MFDLNSKILIVDDMLTMRKLVAKTLKEIGFKTFVEASDGRKAWDELSSADPPIDIIISDWNMPNASGIDFLKRVRSESRFKHLPFVLVTAESEASQIKEAITAGVSNYVVKPFTGETIKAKLEAVHKKISGG